MPSLMSKHIHAIMILKAPSGPLVHCKVLEQDLSPKGIPFLQSVKEDLLMWWYYMRYSPHRYKIETAGFESLEHFFRNHPECERFLKDQGQKT
jgi:hypothetical protein